MTIRPIVRYPDPRLALPAQPVTAFDGTLRGLARDLLETMHAAPGIGITAPHIGVCLRVVVLDLDPIDGARTYVNPEIIWASPETITIKVWGDTMSPFGLFASASGSQCIPIPGIGGGVVLDFPVVPVTAGLLTEVTPCLSCPPGLQTLQIPIPPNLPPGTSLALQGIALGNGQLAFTIAITGTV